MTVAAPEVINAASRLRRRPSAAIGTFAWMVSALACLFSALSGPLAAQPLVVAPGDGTPPPPPAEAGATPQPASPVPPPLSQAAFELLLEKGDLEQLNQACLQTLQEGRSDRLRLIKQRLLELHPAPQPLPVVLANADVLLNCRMPQGALDVLDRIGPAAGAERIQWLVLQWRAATAALDHRRASLALERLQNTGPAAVLETLTLPVQQKDDGSVVSRQVVDLLAGHLEARGMNGQAAELLLRADQPGVAGAERLETVVRLLAEAPMQEREALLEAALARAGAVGAWGLVAALLDQQAALPSSRGRARRLRLSPRIDDAYGEWLLRRDDPADRERSIQLERRLRSPRDPGGHAPDPTASAPLAAPTAPKDPAPVSPAPSLP